MPPKSLIHQIFQTTHQKIFSLKTKDNLDIADWDKVICVYCELEDVDWNDPLPWLPLPNFKHSEMARLMGCTDEEFIEELEEDEKL